MSPSTFSLDPNSFQHAAGKTVLVTGGAGGIGAATAALYNKHGANVAITDLPMFEDAAKRIVDSLDQPSKATFIPANILDWSEMKAMFRRTIDVFGGLDIVIANAGVMESKPVLDVTNIDEHGEPQEPREAYKVIDVNLKGTLNTLRLAMHHMAKSGGSIILVASTSGYLGGTGVVSYVASKHGVIGLLRGSQIEAQKLNIRVNGIAPFFTPTHITSSYAEQWEKAGLEANTPEGVAKAILQVSVEEQRKGECVLVSGSLLRELETSRKGLFPEWFGQEVVALMGAAGDFFKRLGGYPLPQR